MKILKLLFLLSFSSVVIAGQIGWLQGFNFWKKRNAVQSYQVQDYDHALELFHDLMDQDPYNSEYNYNVGDIFYKQKKYQDAHHAFLRAAERALPSSKLQEQALFNAGNSLYQIEAWLQAVQAYQQVLKINEENKEAQHNLQLALYKLQEQQMKDEQEKQQNQQEEKQDEQMNPDKNSSQENGSQDKDCGCEKSQDFGKDDGKSGGKKSDQSSGNEKEKSEQGDQVKDDQQGNDNHDENTENGQEQGEQEKNLEEGNESGQQKGQEQENKDFQDKGSQDQSDLDALDAEKLAGTQNQNMSESENDFDQSDHLGQDQADNEDKSAEGQGQDKKGALGAYKKPELKNELKDDYESKASDDDRLTDYHASVMKTLEDLEEKIQKHVIKNKVAMQGVGQHGKKGW